MSGTEPVPSGGDLPMVSCLIPCRMEERFIGRCLASLAGGDYPPDKLEILVLDGMSTDRTRPIVQEWCSRDPRVRLLDNPKQKTPAALNIGLREAGGEIILRLDAHAEIPRDYIARCVRSLDDQRADVAGGSIETRPGADSIVGRCIAGMLAHPFGVGNSAFRTSRTGGWVDTVPFGAYRRSLFEKVGQFDERLDRNQDNELSSRILRSGGRIYMVPGLSAVYYAPGTLQALISQAVRTGRWNVRSVLLNPESFRVRHFVPLVFFMAILGLPALAWAGWHVWGWWGGLVGAYGVAAGISAIQIGRTRGARVAMRLPFLFLTYHLSYGLGTVWEMGHLLGQGGGEWWKSG